MAVDIAIDTGTSLTRIFLPHKGVVLCEPSVIAVRSEDNRMVAVGAEAYEMLGRTPPTIRAVYPLKGGVISDCDLAETMLSAMLGKVVSPKIRMPRAAVCVPTAITDVEKRAVVSAVIHAGMRQVCLIESPVAAAMGAGLDIRESHGSLVVDIGGGTTDMAVISLNGIAVSRSLQQAGDAMDEAIIKYVRRKHDLLIGRRTAENAKKQIGCVTEGVRSGTFCVKGSSLSTGLPDSVVLKAEEMPEPLAETALTIVSGICELLEETPPELIGDIYTDGIMLTGGGALVAGLDKLISDATDLRVHIAESPSACAVCGCGQSLSYLNRLETSRPQIHPFQN